MSRLPAGTIARLMAARRAGAIPRREPGVPVPLTPAQERIRFLQQAGQDFSAYLCWAGERLRGELREEAVRQALSEIVARHEALRTALVEQPPAGAVPAAGPVQVVHEAVDPPLEVAEADGEAEARALTDAFVTRPMPPDRPPLLRALLVRLAPDDHVLVLAAHHAICDGASMGVLLSELYGLLAGAVLEPPGTQFPDYAAQLSGGGEREREFWREELSGAPSLLSLPADRPRPAVPSGAGARVSVTLTPARHARLRDSARAGRDTTFTIMLAALAITLSRLAGQDDVVIGSPADGRDLPELERSVGMYVNTLALRLRLDGDPTVGQVREQAFQVAMRAVDHRATPFDEVVGLAAGARDLSHNPLFQVMLVEEAAAAREPAGGLRREAWWLPAPEARFDLTVVASTGQDFVLHLDYAADLFDEPSMTVLSAQLVEALDALLDTPDLRLSQVLTPDEGPGDGLSQPMSGIVADEPSGPSSAAAPDGDLDVVAEIAAQARIRPGAPALIDAGGVVTYGELLARADDLAGRLRPLIEHEGTVVGMALPTGTDAVIAIVGILRAGAAYLPLDPTHPPARLAGLLARAGAAAVVHPGLTVQPLPAKAAAGTAGLAYVIYTSGSTGAPKGVMVTHRTLSALTRSFRDVHGFAEGHRVLMLPPLTFDASVGDLFPVLTSGAALVTHPEPARLDGQELLAFCREHRITAVDTAASLWRRWVADLADEGVPDDWPVTLVMVGGEEVRAQDARTWQRLTGGRCDLVNHYGPTEATVCATTHWLRGGDDLTRLGRVPIGTPLPHVRARIQDRGGRPVPRGAVGELFLGGDCLARGYLGEPALTAAAFVPDPSGPPGARMYGTGDLARMRPDGSIEFHGRRDRQVKVRGHRIEPAEIEQAVAAYPGVTDSVVTAARDRLVAYVAGVDDPDELRRFLRARLPGHLVPGVIVPVEAIALTAHGKIDHSALPEAPDAPGRTPPRGDGERRLAEVWQRVLGVPEVGRNDGFFAVGGHSLLAAKVVTEIRREFGVELPLRAVLETADLAELAALIERGALPDETPDLEAHATLPQDLAEAFRGPYRTSPRRAGARTILLTGATGFLGAHLVEELLARTDATLLCLVRAADPEQAVERVVANRRAYGLAAGTERLAGLPGDLTAERFGLDEVAFSALAGTVDVICHNGGRVNFAESFERLRPANVGGTLSALRLAALGGADLHLVSTLGVFLGSAHRDQKVTENDPPDDPAGLGSGYDMSKWVADRLARHARQAGARVSVHRPARVTGHSVTGRGNAGDYFSRLLVTCLQLGMVPDLEHEEDLAPVDHVAAGIAHLIGEGQGGDHHYFNAATLSYAGIAGALEAELVPWRRWRQAVLDQGDAGPMAPFAGVLGEEAPRFDRPGFDCSHTENLLARAGIVCPPAGPDLLRRYVADLTGVSTA
ncbi:non-ribosomal peptide synthetase [Nonomuraea soli]|uniref:Amino acid adenylation domain-containing protein/thioester reductase-like protein n=1 Tax=Nonomuraea soli TaxID=1032476 RepID=A0A7W0CGH4_9ACTN|nr:non-ribosomal peptide synthetase [Nonomuraea soli]MBA2890567.1 amino acid adenylation domain-containing protein/thioester reductase-like protein [Nonomuraea soli]